MHRFFFLCPKWSEFLTPPNALIFVASAPLDRHPQNHQEMGAIKMQFWLCTFFSSNHVFTWFTDKIFFSKNMTTVVGSSARKKTVLMMMAFNAAFFLLCRWWVFIRLCRFFACLSTKYVRGEGRVYNENQSVAKLSLLEAASALCYSTFWALLLSPNAPNFQ